MSNQPIREGGQGDLGDFAHSVQAKLASRRTATKILADIVYEWFSGHSSKDQETPPEGANKRIAARQKGSKRRAQVPLVPLLPLPWDRSPGKGDTENRPSAGGRE